MLLELLPVDFAYRAFAALLLLNGLGDGPVRLAEPGRDHEQPAGRARAASGPGMTATFQNSAMVLSIGVFFSLMIVGLAEHPAGGAVEPG